MTHDDVRARLVFLVVDAGVLAAADADAKAAGLSRSEMVELALRNERLRRELQQYVEHINSPAGQWINDYADSLYKANLATGLF